MACLMTLSLGFSSSVYADEISVKEQTKVVSEKSVVKETPKSVRIGDTYYSTLKEAFENVKAGSQTTVVLEDDFVFTTSDIVTLEEGKDVILNMNEHKITVNSDFTGRPIVNKGTMKIIGNGTIDSSASNTGGYGAVDNYGTLVIDNGTFTGSVNASGAVAKNRPGATLTINNGTFNGATAAVYNEGTTYIHNGLFDGRSCSACNSKSWGYTVQNQKNRNSNVEPKLYFYNGTVIGVQGALATAAGYSEIRDGEFKTAPCKNHPTGNTAFYALYVAGESGKVETNIYGGTFTSSTKAAAYIGNSNDGGDKKEAIANFYGGKFVGGNGAKETVHVDNQLGGLEITGGTYQTSDGQKYDVSAYIPDGTNLNQDENGNIIHSHNLTHVDAKDATCEEDGNIEYWHCGDCNEYYKDVAGLNQIQQKDTVIAALGHDEQIVNKKDATCTEDGYTGDKVCKRCNKELEKGQLIAKLAHTYGDEFNSDEENHWKECTVCHDKKVEAHQFTWVIDKEATATETGSKHEECTTCGYKKASVEIPVLAVKPDPEEPSDTDKPGDTDKPADTDKPSDNSDNANDNANTDKDTDVPQTGDQTTVGLFTLLLTMSGLLIAILAVSRKKSTSEK